MRMSHWGRNNKSFYKSRLSAYNKCAHAVSLKIGLAIMNGVRTLHGTEVRFGSFLSGGFTTIAVINPLEMKLTKQTSVQWLKKPFGHFSERTGIAQVLPALKK